MKKICHITTVHPRYDIRIFHKECKWLACQGYDIILIVNDQFADETIEGVRILSTHEKKRGRLERMLKASQIVYKMAMQERADLYHIHDPELLWMALKLYKKGKKVVFDSHEFTAMQILMKDYLPTFMRKGISKLYHRQEEYILRKIDGVISPCPYKGKDYFESICENRVYVNNFPIAEKLLRQGHIVQKMERVCYVGDISEERGAVFMVKGASMARIPLILGGNISQLDLKEKLEGLPEYKNVIYVGKVEHNEAIEIINNSTVGISVLQNVGQYADLYNLPTKVYEYMALGIPVVISDFPYVREVLKEYEFGIAVNPSDEMEIAKAIVKIVKDRELSKKMGEEGQRAIREKFSWEKEGPKLDDFYKKVLKEKKL